MIQAGGKDRQSCRRGKRLVLWLWWRTLVCPVEPGHVHRQAATTGTSPVSRRLHSLPASHKLAPLDRRRTDTASMSSETSCIINSLTVFALETHTPCYYCRCSIFLFFLLIPFFRRNLRLLLQWRQARLTLNFNTMVSIRSRVHVIWPKIKD